MKLSPARLRPAEEEICSGNFSDGRSELACPGDAPLANRYRLDYLLGRGGTSSVYAARDLTLERDVAIKFLPAEHMRKPSGQESFHREVHTAANLYHPHIAHTYDSALLPDGSAYIVMELLPGVTLRQHLRNRGALPVPVAFRIIRQIASALETLHHGGTAHGDLTPSNIMVSEADDGHWQSTLVDFGASRPLTAVGRTSPSTQIVIGTARYLAPEQFAGINGDARSDVYSLGVILFETLTGRTPLHFRSAREIALAHACGRSMPGLRSFCKSVPPALEQFVAKALHADRAARWQSAANLVQAIIELETETADVTLDITPTLAASSEDERTTDLDRADCDLLLSASTTAELQYTPVMRDSTQRFA